MNDMTSVETPVLDQADPRNGLETGMLAFARSLQISEGLFSAWTGDRLVPIVVEEKGARGQSGEDNAKNPGLSNPQVVDFACMPSGAEKLFLTFTLRTLPTSAAPYASNNGSVAANYRQMAQLYGDIGGYRHLAGLYAWNILNGRFAWRNRFQSDDAEVSVTFGGMTLTARCLDLDLDMPASFDEMAAVISAGDKDAKEALEALISGIERGLCSAAFEMDVVFSAKLKQGMEIWPSQEYIRDEDKKEGKSRYYASLPCQHGAGWVRQASMHSQKIGAAIRHIDIWHDDARYGAVAVNPYAGVQETGDVLRSGKDKAPSFYDVRKGYAAMLAQLEAAGSAEELDGSIHFFFANLIRGGVFGGKDPAKATEKAAKKGKGK